MISGCGRSDYTLYIVRIKDEGKGIMEHFIAHRLSFTCEAMTAVSLPRQNGSALRGAFFSALRRDFCLNNKLDSCLRCPTAEVCPICLLIATVDRENSRGAEVPRPFALEPIIAEKMQFEPGETFSFSITLFGRTLQLFPYILLAVQRMGEIGIGNRSTAPGRFQLQESKAVNPFTGTQKSIYSKETQIIDIPDNAITHNDVLAHASRLNPDKLELRILTPLRLVVAGSLVQKLTFRLFMQRLLRRLTDLQRYFDNQTLELNFPKLLEHAMDIQITEDNTHWIDLSSYSSRRRTTTPIGGLLGEITLEGRLKEFLPLLVWGEITHVGKDATRGNGWYQIANSLS